jgi:hypothetical protein
MSLSNLFQNRAYVINPKLNIEQHEIDLINNILLSLKTPIKTSEIKLISVNDEYDTYKFIYNDFSYCLKISLDEDCESLKKEAHCLENINHNIRPSFFEHGCIKIGDNIRYLITSYENAESIFNLGRSYIVENFDNFCEAYLLMQDSNKVSYTIKDSFKKVFEMADIENYFLEDSLAAIKNYTDLNKLKQFLSNMKNEILLSYDGCSNDSDHICHGNLNYNNIISRNGFFKFINFENCLTSHCFLDFSKLIIELGIDKDLELLLLERFCKFMDIDYVSNLDLYKKYYALSIRQKIIEITVEYLKEVYLYASLRKDKIIKLCDRFSQSYDRFVEIPYFNEHKEFLIKTLTEPIFNVKA